MALFYSTELYVTNDQRKPVKEEPLPEALRHDDMFLLMRVLCFCALGRPDLEDHWKSLQSEEKFEIARTRVCSVLDNVITAAEVLLATSGVFITTGSPVTYFDYSSPAPYFLLLVSFMLAMIAMLTSGSSKLRWIQTDRQWTRERLKLGGYFVVSYLLSIVTPMLFVAWSLHCFILAMVLAGISSKSTVCRALTVLWMVTYIANTGTISTEFVRKYATSSKSR
ncbi:hypothetical protein EDD22DRAFT_902377 [Suillus occidentalis]|nr:hypothetical protein EDD22DRAFT_902377 [Suillus occidentalis]